MKNNQYQDIIEKNKGAIIQIATPYSVGTGFYMSAYDIIVTNEHVVRDNREVVVDGDYITRQMVEVVFLDEVYDLAFLKTPKEHSMPKIHLRSDKPLTIDEPVISLGHPFGQQYQSRVGIVLSAKFNDGEANYYEHTASLSPGNSGGPLFDIVGKVVGVNTFLVESGKDIGYSLPLERLIESIQAYEQSDRVEMVKCGDCNSLIKDPLSATKHCTHCGTRIVYLSQIPVYEAIGINQQIEQMLEELGYDPKISRRGPYNWEVEQGSALIHITYHEKTGLINGDAHLCKLPDQDVLPLYNYLLKANYDLQGLSFTVKDNEVILSLLIYDQYLNKLTALRLFKHLFDMADHYDDILVDDYHAKWLTL